MKKLEKLKLERGIVSMLTFIPKQTKQMLDRFYESSIFGIEHHGLDNNTVDPESLYAIREIIDKWSGGQDGGKKAQ